MYRIMEGCLRQRRLKWCGKRERWRSLPGIRVRLRRRRRLWRRQGVGVIPHPLGNRHRRGSRRRLGIGSVAPVLVAWELGRITFATLPLTWGAVAIHRRWQSGPTRRRGDGHGLLSLRRRKADRRPRTPHRTHCLRARKLVRSHEALNYGPPCLRRSRVRMPMATVRAIVSLRAEGRKRLPLAKP